MSRPADRTLALYERAREGDDEAYDRLFALAEARVRLYVRLRLGRGLRGKLDSDDVLQDAYLAAHRDFDRFRWMGDASFTRWLCRIVENRIRGLAEHHGAAKRAAPGAMARVSRLVNRIAADMTSPASRAARQEDTDRLAGALDGLEDGPREIVLLRFFAGMSLDQIADLAGQSRSTVRRTLGRAAVAVGAALEGAR